MSSAAARGGRQIVPRPDAWRAGGPAPWEEPAAASSFALSVVVEAVAGFDVADDVPRPAPDARRSAVLLALHDGPEGAEVVLTRRAQALRRHHGEISFPGGRLEPGETPEAGALREAHEEVALDPRVVELVGRLSTLSTVSSLSHIVPVVGRLPGRPRLRPAQAEVERILHLPLVELTRDGVFREERWGEAAGERAIYFFELADETIWGATARILVELLTVVLAA
ncbi:MAG TPA: CoA pyrophosphatase [Acidimicrobiales bacterium]|nr:CoA pyrophosphatase [Acidimicrobiales bacterium]